MIAGRLLSLAPYVLAAATSVATAAYAALPHYDYDATAPGVQGPSSPLLASPDVRLFRQHQITVRMCAAIHEVVPFVAPHVPVPSPLCGGGNLLGIQFILNEMQESASGAGSSPVSRMNLIIPASNGLRTEFFVTESLPILEVQIEESLGGRAYRLGMRDAAEKPIDLRLVVDVTLEPFKEDPIVGGSLPLRFRILESGASFFVARSGYRAQIPASAAQLRLSFHGKAIFARGSLSLGPLVGEVDVYMPSLLLLQFE